MSVSRILGFFFVCILLLSIPAFAEEAEETPEASPPPVSDSVDSSADPEPSLEPSAPSGEVPSPNISPDDNISSVPPSGEFLNSSGNSSDEGGQSSSAEGLESSSSAGGSHGGTGETSSEEAFTSSETSIPLEGNSEASSVPEPPESNFELNLFRFYFACLFGVGMVAGAVFGFILLFEV